MVELAVGASDRGKTHTLTLLARESVRQGVRTAIVDADTGQSEIGPPGTVGVAWARAETERWSDLKPLALYFVGALSPASAALEQVVAVVQAVRRAYASGAQRIFIDSPGYVVGPGARRFLIALATAVAPQRLRVFERDGELGSLPAALQAATGAELEAMPVSDAVVRRSSAVRTTRRLARLSRALDGAEELLLPLESVTTVGAALGVGTPLAPHLTQWAGTALRLPLVYGESAEGVVTLFTDSPVPTGWESGSGPIADALEARSLRLVSLRALENVCLGLLEEGGRFLALGRCVGLDRERHALIAAVPPPATAERITQVVFGRFRLGADGTVLGELRPGEL